MICLRLKTYQFTSYNEVTFSYQAVLTAGPVWLLGAYIGLPCDQRYLGCTQKHKDRYGKDWKHSKVIGYTGDRVENHDFKTWQPGVWNSKFTIQIYRHTLPIWLARILYSDPSSLFSAFIS